MTISENLYGSLGGVNINSYIGAEHQAIRKVHMVELFVAFILFIFKAATDPMEKGICQS